MQTHARAHRHEGTRARAQQVFAFTHGRALRLALRGEAFALGDGADDGFEPYSAAREFARQVRVRA